MAHITRPTLTSLLFAALLSFGYIAAQQSPSQQSERTQRARTQTAQTTLQQESDQFRDQVAQLQMQVKDLQAAIDDLRSEQQTIEATAKETRELVLDTRMAQARGREELNSLMKVVGQNEKHIDKLGQQVSSMMLDLRRVKTKVGLY